jgi:hypothetical protein
VHIWPPNMHGCVSLLLQYENFTSVSLRIGGSKSKCPTPLVVGDKLELLGLCKIKFDGNKNTFICLLST